MAETPTSSPTPTDLQRSQPDPPHTASSVSAGRKWMINVVIPLLLLGAAGGVVVALGSVEPENRPPDDNTRTGRLRALPPVRVERLQSLESTGKKLHLEVDGNVVPYREAQLAAEVAGRIVFKSEVCEAGSYVKEGALLMRIDPTDYELEVQRLSRLQEQEYEALGEVDQEMANAQRLIAVAQEDVKLQQREVDRQKSLPSGFASNAEVDQANRALLAATQQLISIENQLALLRKRRVKLEASERLAATQLQAAEVNLKRTEIRAPLEGVIVREDAELNTFVARGNTLVTIEDTSKVEVATNLRMDQLYWVLDQKGKRIDDAAPGYDLPETPAIVEYEITGRSGATYRWHGRLLRYDGIGLDPVTRTVPVRVVVENPKDYVDADGKSMVSGGATPLVRGMFVRVRLLIQPQSQLVVIPARALQPGNRVLQFLPDESVLDPAITDVSQDDPAASNDASSASPPITEPAPDDGSRFDPDQWEPGRVVVRQSVNPVDSLSLDDADDSGSRLTDSPFASSARLWVCEVRDAGLSGDSLVVVSPLGDFDEKGLPVRAQRTGATNDPRRVDRDTQGATAAAERGDGEDA